MEKHQHQNWCANTLVGAPWACGHHSKENFDTHHYPDNETKGCERYEDKKKKCGSHYKIQNGNKH